MITALVQFKLPQPISNEQAQETFLSTAEKYTDIAGLIRKYYVLSPDGETAGGMYLWQSQKDAEQFYTPAWQQFIADKYGALPTVSYFNCPVVVDNLMQQIITDQ